MDEFLEWFDGLYEAGDWAIITAGSSGGMVITEEGNDPAPDPAAKHDYEGKGKIKFARWCEEQLNNGKCLKAGKTGDTHWADIVPY